MEEPRLSATGLPQLYAAWVDDLLDGTIPDETEATRGSWGGQDRFAGRGASPG